MKLRRPISNKNHRSMSTSQSHGGALYYIVEVPREEYEYDAKRRHSTESGWDNPFRPGGDLSREADEIVNLIKGGKPITPTGEQNVNIGNGDVQKPSENGTVVDGATKVEAQQLQASVPHQQNGTKSPQKITNLNNNNNLNKNNNNNNTTTIIDKPPTSAATNGDATNKTQTQISNQTLPTPQSASHVTIEDKKKKKSCCVIQ